VSLDEAAKIRVVKLELGGTMTRICILGGGFGGLYTALELARLPWADRPEIVLIDRSDRFVFTPLLYELVTGELQTWEIAPPFLDLLVGTGIQFMQGTVTSIDTGVDIGDRKVHLTVTESPTTLSYDRLVLAIGGETSLNLVPGAAEYAIPFRNLADVQRLESKLQELEASDREKIRICIAGAGASGVELACKLADRLKSRGRVRLVERDATILTNSPVPNRIAAERALTSRGIWTDLATSVSQVMESEIALDYLGGSDTLPVDIVMWTVGNGLSKLGYNLGLPQNSRSGRILTETTLQVKGHEDIYALGDLAECYDFDGTLVPTTAQAAYQQSQYCARNIWVSLTQPNRPQSPFRYLPLGEFMSLGVDNASLAFLDKFALEGAPAYIFRRLAYLMRMPTLQHQLKLGFNWLSRPVKDAINLTK
jgi:demethylphylloquinone reductase